VAPTGNQLQSQAPRAAPRAPGAERRAPPSDAPRAPARAPGPPRPPHPAGAGPRPAGAHHRTKLSRRGVNVVLAGSLLLLTALAVGAGVLTSSGAPGADGLPPATVRVVAGTPAASVAFSANVGWLADDHTGTLRRFDPSTGAGIGRPVHLGGRPISVVSGFGRLWVADIAGSQVFEVDPTRGKVVGAPIAVPDGPVSLAAGDGGVWVASLLAGAVSVIDPRTGQVRASETLPDGAVRLVVGPEGVWVSGQTDSLTRVDPRPVGSLLQSRAVSVGQGPIGVAVGDGSVWVANVKSGSVSRVDPGSMRVTATYSVGGVGGGVPANPEMVAVWRGLVWVADGQQGVVVALDPVTGVPIGASVAVPGVIRMLALDSGGTLLGTTANPGTVVRFSG
jgi:streptogramin lyase